MAEDILVLRLSSLGDVVLTSSFLQSAAEHFPGARITFVVRDDLSEVAGALPHVAQVVPVRRAGGLGELRVTAGALARTPWAHVFDLHRSLRSRLLTLRLGPRLRPGFDKQELPRWMLVHCKRDIYARFGGSTPMRERMLAPLGRLGFAPQLHPTRLVVPAAARARAATALGPIASDARAPLVGLVPGARWPSKRWPAERYATLATRLAAETSTRLVLVGGAADREACSEVARAAGPSCTDLAGELGILETAAVLERCALVIANDSGLLHVAEAVGRPVLGFFGPTAPQFGYTPYRAASRMLRQPPPCSPCSKNGSRPCSRPTHECMENISVGSAFAAATDMLHQLATAG